MEPLVTNRLCLIWLRMCPAGESISRWQKLAHAIFATFVLTGTICSVAASFAFWWKFVSIDFGRSIFACLIIIVEFVVIYMALAGMIFLRHKIGRVFDNLSTIYRDGKYFLPI